MAELQRVGILAVESFGPLPYAMASSAGLVCHPLSGREHFPHDLGTTICKLLSTSQSCQAQGFSASRDKQVEGESAHEAEMAASRSLMDAARACEGFSGRMLRKLPFLAHAGDSCLSA